MEFFIRKNSTLPKLMVEFINESRVGYHQTAQDLLGATITFSMIDEETGIIRYANLPATIELNTSTGGYTLVYQFTRKTSSKTGRFYGEFTVINSKGVSVLPVRDVLNINITDSFADSDACCKPYKGPNVTPTPSITARVTSTPTNTPTTTPTNTPTQSVTPTNTQTPTITPTQSVTPTNTQTPTITPSPTPTNTVTPTVTPSPTTILDEGLLLQENYFMLLQEDGFGIYIEPLQSSPTPTPTQTPTNTPTNSVTPTQTQTPSQTPSGTISITPAVTNTATNTPTSTPTTTVTPTISETPTNTPTNTITNTPTPTSTPAAPITSNLVLYYDPSNVSSYLGSGTTINDLSGNGLNGSMSGITFTSPYFTYNGTPSQVRVSDNPLLEPGSGDWTMEVWVNQTTSGNDVVLGKFDFGGLAADVSYSIRTIGTAYYAQFGSGIGSGGGPTGTLFVDSTRYTGTTNTWYQIVYVFKNVGTKTLETYINGSSIGSVIHNLASILNSTTPLYIGSYNGGEYSQWFDGKIGITRLYNTSLTSSQVLQNFNADKSKYGL
jgi:hypothetical protein